MVPGEGEGGQDLRSSGAGSSPAAGPERERERQEDRLNTCRHSYRLLSPLIWFKLNHLVTLNAKLSRLLLLSLWEQRPEGRGMLEGCTPGPSPEENVDSTGMGVTSPSVSQTGASDPGRSLAPQEGSELVSNPSNQAERGVPSPVWCPWESFPGQQRQMSAQSSHCDATAQRKERRHFHHDRGAGAAVGMILPAAPACI